MVLTRNVQRTLPIPHEPGESMTLRQLGWLDLSHAEEVRSNAALKNLQTMGAELFTQLQSTSLAQAESAAATATEADPLAKYDKRTLLIRGVIGWSYREPVNPLDNPDDPSVEKRPVPVTEDAIDSLDAATADWAAREIAGLGGRLTERQSEADFLGSPNTSTGSTATVTVSPRTNGSLG